MTDQLDVRRIETMADHDLLVEMAVNQRYILVDVSEIKEHQKRQNGEIATIKKEQYKQEGALGALSSMLRIVLVGISAGAAVAMVILAIVARGIGG